MIFTFPRAAPGACRLAIEAAQRVDEATLLRDIMGQAHLSEAARRRIDREARRLVEGVRARRTAFGGLDVFLGEYGLSTEEGVALMCLAESLLRVPDRATASKLIRDKLGGADWERHLGKSSSLFVNASTWALMLSGRMMRLDGQKTRDLEGFLGRLAARGGEPVIRRAMVHAMRIVGRQFVMGETIEGALDRAAGEASRGYRHSFDMLGEGARTEADAQTYLESYRQALQAIGAGAGADRSGGKEIFTRPAISVKLSALHPRYEYAQRRRVLDELVPRLVDLSRLAREAGIGLCVDAEEEARLELSLDVIEAALSAPELRGWNGFGFAVQAYLKRAMALIDWAADQAATGRRRLMVRLVKGAYWDMEIKHAQEGGLGGYPVFTRKVATDVSYLACAKRLLAQPDLFFPQFATHNAHTVAAVMEMTRGAGDFEFQRLHGMGEALYDQLLGTGNPCRVYAPVGGHQELLAYFARRLLENGANSSFVNRIADDAAPITEIVADPVSKLAEIAELANPRIPLPTRLFGQARLNSAGLDLCDPAVLRDLAPALEVGREFKAAPLIAGQRVAGADPVPLRNPADRRQLVGEVCEGQIQHVEEALEIGTRAAGPWDQVPAAERADILERAAALFEEARGELIGLAIREAGKTLPDALAEIRETVDFCRYYADRARIDFAQPETLLGPTGEDNRLSQHGRGLFVTISPWNFPLAIFTGQIAAALAAGNAVIAKPAEQTPLIAARAVELLHRAGVPGEVLQFIPGDGARIGGGLVGDPRVNGVAFTGSFETARLINQLLAGRPGAIAPLIAETGGMNAMIVDSTALIEQAVDHILSSAFRGAGQRCSALRVLFVQNDIADRLLDLLCGALDELSMGDPSLLATDVGPVIDADALARLEAHAQRMEGWARLIARASRADACAEGTFFAPRIYEIERMGEIGGEVFGPILHVIRYAADRLDQVVDEINATGFGLTLGIHSRVEATVGDLHRRLRVGNTYVNREMIGAVVGVQPFGGEGFSGTGPKAGGPRYLHRFATERSLAVDTTAAGGNAALLSAGGGE